jgi:glutamate transport system permease protein
MGGGPMSAPTTTAAPPKDSATPVQSILYDVPGPRTRARYRLYGAVSAVLLAALTGFVIWRFYDTGQFSGRKWEIFLYSAVQETLLRGLFNTLRAAAVAAVLALLLAAVLAAARISDHAIVRAPAVLFVEFFRAVPLLILIFFFYYAAPELGLQLSTFWAVVLGLTLYNGSVLAEVFRAGLLAVPKGQREAAFALGLRKNQVVRLVLLPQAVRAMLPAIVSQLVVLLKDTALGFLITYRELLTEARQLMSSDAFEFRRSRSRWSSRRSTSGCACCCRCWPPGWSAGKAGCAPRSRTAWARAPSAPPDPTRPSSPARPAPPVQPGPGRPGASQSGRCEPKRCFQVPGTPLQLATPGSARTEAVSHQGRLPHGAAQRQVRSRRVRASRSARVTVSCQALFTVIHRRAYAHRYARFGGTQASTGASPLERFTLAAVACRLRRSFANASRRFRSQRAAPDCQALRRLTRWSTSMPRAGSTPLR